MSVRVKMPGSGDERIDPSTIFVIREPFSVEKEESPTVQSCIWGSGYRIYPIETVPVLLEKFEQLNFARLTAPGGLPLFVNAGRVTDRDDRSAVLDHEKTNSVLCFGPGPLAPRVRVQETTDDLIMVWKKLGLPTDMIT